MSVWQLETVVGTYEDPLIQKIQLETETPPAILHLF